MKKPLFLALALTTSTIAVGFAQPVNLSTGEVDIGLAFEAGAWDLHAHDETTDIEYEPGEVVLQALAGSQTTVPSDPQYSFLGAPGAPVWYFLRPRTRTCSISASVRRRSRTGRSWAIP